MCPMRYKHDPGQRTTTPNLTAGNLGPAITQADRRTLVAPLEKGLDVLAILAAHPAGMTLTEMAEEAGLTRAGARRLLLTLVATSHAAQDGRLFRLTPLLLALARQWLDGTSLWSFAEPHMRK